MNPSYLIANSLPASHKAQGSPIISIHTYPHPIEVCYKTVRSLIPTLLFPQGQGATYDLILNLGLAPGRNFYSIEACAHRDDYVKQDILHESMEGDTCWRVKYGAPRILQPTIDISDTRERWQQRLPDDDVRVSGNAGRYLCEYTFYTTMLEFWQRNQAADRRCIFLHVPNGCNEEDIQKGRGVVLALIEAAISSEQTKRERAELELIFGPLKHSEVPLSTEGDGG